MGRSISPILQRELENLDKDADSRKSAMKALKSYVKELDSKAIPLFLAQVSETKETGSSGEYTISLYEVLARVHGTKIVPQIDNIMATIIKTLSASAGSFALHQACSKVVPAIARYGMEPTTTEDKKRWIIQSLCKPLSDSLLGSHESLSSGAALCLKALVDCDNWRYASNDMVNEVCQRVAGALAKHMQTNSHMALVMALAKHNSLTVEAYARLLIQAGLQILNAGVAEGNSQKRLTSIHMLNTMMKCLDTKSIFFEVGLMIDEMEKFQSDQMAYVRGAAYEALQTAKRICIEKSPKFERDNGSVTGSNFDRRGSFRRRNLSGSRDQTPLTASPESRTVDSFLQCDSFIESPNLISQASRGLMYDQRSVNRKLWPRSENGGVDVSLKDRIFSEAARASPTENTESDEFSADLGDYTDGFTGFFCCSASNRGLRSSTPSPQRPRSHINVDSIEIFTTPRKLIHSLQELNDVNSDYSEKQSRRFTSPSTRKLEWSPTTKCEQNGLCNGLNHKVENDGRLSAGGEQYQNSSESVSSTEELLADAAPQVFPKVLPSNTTISQSMSIKKGRWQPARYLVYGTFIILFGVSVFFLWNDDEDAGYNLVPT